MTALGEGRKSSKLIPVSDWPASRFGLAIVNVSVDVPPTVTGLGEKLFVMVGGLDAAGVLGSVIGLFERMSHIPPLLFGMGLIWIVAALSAVVDNVPITIAFIPVIQGLGQTGMNVEPLWWALAFGAGFGGNGTIIGSTAKIIVANLSEKTHYPITSALWTKRGLPAMLAACAIASYPVYYYL